MNGVKDLGMKAPSRDDTNVIVHQIGLGIIAGEQPRWQVELPRIGAEGPQRGDGDVLDTPIP